MLNGFTVQPRYEYPLILVTNWASSLTLSNIQHHPFAIFVKRHLSSVLNVNTAEFEYALPVPTRHPRDPLSAAYIYCFL